MSKLQSVGGHRPPLQWIAGLKDYFVFFFPPDFLPPADLEAADFLEDPLPDFFAEDLPPPFFDFFTSPPPPPPLGAEGGATGVRVGGLTLAAKRKPQLEDLKSGWLGS